MELAIYQVDAFSSNVFAGNPAAVVPLETWLDDSLMQRIAMENNLAETAFFVRRPGGGYHIRWFTPNTEVDLCGHATLASAWVVFHQLGFPGSRVEFESRSGVLGVDREGDLLALDFPSRPPQQVQPCEGLLEALGGNPREVWASRDYLVVYDSEAEVRALDPSMRGLMNADRFAVIVTAKGSSPETDFVSRFFAPRHGVPEDPVTGSAHSTLIPFWAARLGKTSMTARQVSPRGGVLECEDRGARVRIAGRAALFLKGTIFV
jgi:predicted PhzF superfamily epimerase YddE/YHI9